MARSKTLTTTIGISPATKKRLLAYGIGEKQTPDEIINLILDGKLPELVEIKKRLNPNWQEPVPKKIKVDEEDEEEISEATPLSPMGKGDLQNERHGILSPDPQLSVALFKPDDSLEPLLSLEQAGHDFGNLWLMQARANKKFALASVR